MIGNLEERTSDWYGQGGDGEDGVQPAEYGGDGYWNVDATVHQGAYVTHFPTVGIRGAAYNNSTQAGAFSLYLRSAPSTAGNHQSFRCARGFLDMKRDGNRGMGSRFAPVGQWARIASPRGGGGRPAGRPGGWRGSKRGGPPFFRNFPEADQLSIRWRPSSSLPRPEAGLLPRKSWQTMLRRAVFPAPRPAEAVRPPPRRPRDPHQPNHQ